jgi:hypothetical protein
MRESSRLTPATIKTITKLVQVPLKMNRIQTVKRALDKGLGVGNNYVRPV